MHRYFIMLAAALLLSAAMASAGRPKAGASQTTGASQEEQTAAPAAPAPRKASLKYGCSLGNFQMITPTQEISPENPDQEMTYEQMMNLMRAAHGKDVQEQPAMTPAAPQVVLCSECEGVRGAMTEFLGKGSQFKIRDGSTQPPDFQIEGIILNKTVRTSSAGLQTKKSNFLENFIPDPNKSGVKQDKASIRMDITVQIKNAKTGEIRSKQFAGTAEAKDLGLNVAGIFKTSSEQELNIATACADAAKQAAAWIELASLEISEGIEIWADVVKVKQGASKTDSMITINLGTVDGVVLGLKFEIGEPLEVRPGIYIIAEPAATIETAEVDDYVTRAVVVSSISPVDAKKMKAKLVD